ncbi:MAG: serine hydrolase [Saprospiraceae bacterium]|nr:serine hydrolase [Saprospiraceae bacterium]
MLRIIVCCLLMATPSFVWGQTEYLPPIGSDGWETISPAALDWDEGALTSVLDFVKESNSKAFLLMVDGRMVVESYYDRFTRDSVWYWASAGKSLAAVMVGIAQEEGHLNIEQPTADFLGKGWTAASSEQEDDIRIRHQLSMSTGLNDNLFSCTLPQCLPYLTAPDSRWSYHNGPYTLTHEVVKQATGTNFTIYTNLKLANIGLSGAWIPLDGNRIFFSTPRSMARFGLFVLNRLAWSTWSPFSSDAYFDAMIQPSQELNQSYGYLWWLHGQDSHMLPGLQWVFDGPINPNCPPDAISALGKNGQVLDIVPSLKLVLVRMGNNPDNALVPVQFHRTLWNLLQQVLPEATPSTTHLSPSISLFPNPVSDRVTLESTSISSPSIQIHDLSGRLVMSHPWHSLQQEISITGLEPGIYHVSTGHELLGKIIVRH